MRQVRSDAAEHLYLVIQGKDFEMDTEDAENILLEAEWCVMRSHPREQTALTTYQVLD